MKNIGVIFGGRSGEYEVSLSSGKAIIANLDHEQYKIWPIAVAKDGRWFGPVRKDDILTFKWENYAENELLLPAKPNEALINAKSGEEVVKLDAIFPIIHGTYGEDGVLQGLFELADLPYVGAGVAASAVGMDKILMRKIFAYHNIPQVRFVTILRKEFEENPQKTAEIIEAALPYPVFVKPANAGSSVGVTKAADRTQLLLSLKEAAKYDRKILIEEGLEVREIEVAVLGNDAPEASVAGEIIASNEFYDYNAKYIDNKSIAKIPAEISLEQREQIQALAIEGYKAIDCAGLARVDFFIEKSSGKIYLNEINTLPGFTEISMYAKLWAASGLPMPKLLDKLLALAEERFCDHKRNTIDFR